MFERFTDRARRVVVLAQEEAARLQHNYIGTEHILLGLLREDGGVAARALSELGISLDAARQQVEEIIGVGKRPVSGHIPFTPRAKKVLEFSLSESLRLGHDYIGTEHILLGLLREGEGVAAQVLVRLGADLNRVRETVISLVPPRPRSGVRTRRAEAFAPGPGYRREIATALADIVARLTVIEEHLGIRRQEHAGAGERDIEPSGPESPESGPEADEPRAESHEPGAESEELGAEPGKPGAGPGEQAQD
jgi:ATP-dependent Clp protease ATP-binding subunit ClpA